MTSLGHHEGVRNPEYFLTPVQGRTRMLGLALAQFISPKPKIRVIDESQWQKDPIDYVRSFKEGQILGQVDKWTQGTTWVDPKRLQHFDGGQEAGRKVMPYHFNEWDLSPEDQAEHFFESTEHIRNQQGPITKYWWDLESLDNTTENHRIDFGFRFVERFDSLAGEGNLGIYSSPYWWNKMFPSGMPEWAKTLWKGVAHWTSATLPILPTGWEWEQTVWWQNGIWSTYWWSYPVIGYTPNVDTGFFFFADKSELDFWITDGAPVPPPPPPPPPPVECTFEAIVTTQASPHLNVRTAPRASALDIGNLPIGGKVEVFSEAKDASKNTWWLIVDHAQNDLAGWAAAIYQGKVYLERV